VKSKITYFSTSERQQRESRKKLHQQRRQAFNRGPASNGGEVAALSHHSNRFICDWWQLGTRRAFRSDWDASLCCSFAIHDSKFSSIWVCLHAHLHAYANTRLAEYATGTPASNIALEKINALGLSLIAQELSQNSQRVAIQQPDWQSLQMIG